LSSKGFLCCSFSCCFDAFVVCNNLGTSNAVLCACFFRSSPLRCSLFLVRFSNMPSDFFRLHSGDFPLLGPKFVESLELRPSFPMATLITPEDPTRAPDSESCRIARSVSEEQATNMSLYSFAPLSPIVFTPKDSVSEVIAERKSLCRSLFVDSAPQELVRFAPPEQVYANYATTAVTAALAVISVRRTKFDDDPPLALAVIAYPSVLPFGHPQPVFDPSAPSTARFEPGGMIPPPDGGTYPLLGSFLHSNRTTELGSEASFRSSFLEGAVVLWGAKTFSHVLAPLSVVGLQPDSPYMDSLSDYIGSLSSMSARCPASDLRMDNAQADPGNYIRLPTILPLGAPSLLPPGIIGDPSLGVSGVAAIIFECSTVTCPSARPGYRTRSPTHGLLP
jgi:hypothetical protein